MVGQLCTYTLPPQLHELCSVIGAQLLGVYWNLLALLSPAVLWELCIEIPDRLCTHTHIYGLHLGLSQLFEILGIIGAC